MTRRRLTLLLVPLGVVLAHVAAYLLPHAEAPNAPEHHHLPGFALLAVGGATLALGSALIGAARGNHVEVNGAALASAQCLVYTALELAEALLNGNELIDGASTPTLWTGLVLQLVVASALAGLLRATLAVGRWLASTGRPRRRHALARHGTRSRRPYARRSASPASLRGPPAAVAHTS